MVLGYYVLMGVCGWIGYEIAMWLIRFGRWLQSRQRARKELDSLMRLQKALDRREKRKGPRSTYRSGLRP